MKIKRKAIQITLSDGQTIVTVHAPSMQQFAGYVNSFAVIGRIGQAFQSIKRLTDGSIDLVAVGARMDQTMIDEFLPLLAMLSDISVEDFSELPVEDGMAIMLAYTQLLAPETLAPPNPTPAAPSEAQPQI